MTLFGPDGRGFLPGTKALTASLVGEPDGAFRYLSDWIDDPGPRLTIREIASKDVEAPAKTLLIDKPDYRLSAIAVQHSVVPALAFVVRSKGAMAVLAGDQSEFSAGFDALLAGSKPGLLVMHHVIPEGPGQPRCLRRPPAQIGEAAARLAAAHLILPHNMKRALDSAAEGRAAIGRSYAGPVTITGDGDCFAVAKAPD